MDFTDRISLVSKISTAFSPSAPIDRKSLFAGRINELRDGINAVSQRGQHVIIYGERGVGKTSFANVLLEIFGENINKPACGLVNCDSTMDFSSLWHKITREMHTEEGTLSDLLPEKVTPDDVRHLLQNVKKTIIILDELDRIIDKSVKTQLADTIKNLSDHSIPTTIVMVGVADSVDALISEHISIQRNLIQIPMPAMSIDELEEVITKGAEITGLTIESKSKRRIALLSQGIPHYAHLLCLHAFTAAVDRDAKNVTQADVKKAIETSISKAMQSVVSGYQNSITSPRKDNLYGKVLLACAMTKTDSLGYFYPADVREPMQTIMGKRYEIAAFSQHLNAFTETERGPILKRSGVKRKFRFKFVDVLMKPYVIMMGLKNGTVTEAKLSL